MSSKELQNNKLKYEKSLQVSEENATHLNKRGFGRGGDKHFK